MANLNKRLPSNAAGNFFVDDTCINCDTCRQIAPSTFQEVDEYSAVYSQPERRSDEVEAYQALLACPVGSIGTLTNNTTLLGHARKSFPIHLEDEVYDNGFSSEKSFGAHSYFIKHSGGNWLIDSPRYVRHLVDRFAGMGGVRYIFLSHEDDVADADRYAARFKATRIIHQADAEAMPGAEWIVTGTDLMPVNPEFLIIPVPGHSAGSLALLYKEKFLFTGDHLWWDRQKEMLEMPLRLVWSMPELLQSAKRLLDLSFEWVLPGHGDRIKLSVHRMNGELKRMLDARLKGCHSKGESYELQKNKQGGGRGHDGGKDSQISRFQPS